MSRILLFSNQFLENATKQMFFSKKDGFWHKKNAKCRRQKLNKFSATQGHGERRKVLGGNEKPGPTDPCLFVFGTTFRSNCREERNTDPTGWQIYQTTVCSAAIASPWPARSKPPMDDHYTRASDPGGPAHAIAQRESLVFFEREKYNKHQQTFICLMCITTSRRCTIFLGDTHAIHKDLRCDAQLCKIKNSN